MNESPALFANLLCVALPLTLTDSCPFLLYCPSRSWKQKLVPQLLPWRAAAKYQAKRLRVPRKCKWFGLWVIKHAQVCRWYSKVLVLSKVTETENQKIHHWNSSDPSEVHLAECERDRIPKRRAWRPTSPSLWTKNSPLAFNVCHNMHFFRLWMKGGTKELFLVCGLILYSFPLTDTFLKAGSCSFSGICAVCTGVCFFMRCERKVALKVEGKTIVICFSANLKWSTHPTFDKSSLSNCKYNGLSLRFLSRKWPFVMSQKVPIPQQCLTQSCSSWLYPGVQKVASPPALNQRSGGRSQNSKSPSLQRQSAYFLPRLFLEASAYVPEITTPARTCCKCHARLLRFQCGSKTKPVCLVCFLSVWTPLEHWRCFSLLAGPRRFT